MFFREFLLETLPQMVVELIRSNSLQNVISNPVSLYGAIVEWILQSLRLSDESEVWVGGLKAFKCSDKFLTRFVAYAGVEEYIVLVWAAVAQTVWHEAMSSCKNCPV